MFQKKLWVVEKFWVVTLCIWVQFALEDFMFWHFGDDLLNAQFRIYSKRPPPSCFIKTVRNFVFIQNAPLLLPKKRLLYHQGAHKMTKFCNYSKRPLLLSKNALTIRKEPTEWPNFVFNQNNPLLLHNSSIKFCIYSKRSPHTLTKEVTSTMEHMKYPNFVFIKKAPHPTSKKAVANFCFYSPKESSLFDLIWRKAK